MLRHARYAYNENSTILVQYVLLAQLGLVLIAGFLHLASWSLGADVGLFAPPAILTALRPLNVALLLPSIGWAIGLLASWLLGDGEDDDLYWSLGIAAGQLACVASLPGTVLG